jgi:chorismate mutase
VELGTGRGAVPVELEFYGALDELGLDLTDHPTPHVHRRGCTTSMLSEVLSDIEKMQDHSIPAKLLELRASIDNIDAAVILMLAERFRCTRAIGSLKAEHNLPPSDPDREAQQVVRLRALAANAGLDPDFADAFHKYVVREVVRHHEQARRGRETRPFQDG